jgi:GDP-L-fucose synthase
MDNYSGESHVNIGWGKDVSIRELAETIAEVIGYTGGFKYATDKPDGTPRKLLDTSMLTTLGWKPKIELKEGLADAYSWYVKSGVIAT